jgi:putative tryptophan/tyrosine transport system substrate-binding protein
LPARLPIQPRAELPEWDQAAKRVQLLKEFIPRVSRVAFLWNPNNASHLAYLDEWRAVAPTMGVEPVFVEVGDPSQLEPAFGDMMRKRPDALSITADPFHLSQVGWIIDFAATNRLPAMYVVRENAVAGGLISYGPSLTVGRPPLVERVIRKPFKVTPGF